MSFYSERQIGAIRKARHCDGCGSMLEVGQPALTCSGHNEGNFWSATYHHDCRKAEEGLNKLHDTWSGDEWISLCHEMDWEDWPWLIEEFPAVAERMKITTEQYNEVFTERERVRLAWNEIDRKRREASKQGTPS